MDLTRLIIAESFTRPEWLLPMKLAQRSVIVATTLEFTDGFCRQTMRSLSSLSSLRHPPLRIPAPVYLRESSLALGQNWRGNKIGSVTTRIRDKVTNGSCIVKSIRVCRDARIDGNIANWSFQLRKRTESRRIESRRDEQLRFPRRRTAVTFRWLLFVTKVFSELSPNFELNMTQINFRRECRCASITKF